ncbi:MAG: matrixin family metalloprotease [Nitrospirae bacterium]|nr:matrixin family metalloprotease [Nitrospirota bacterium]
MLRKLTKRISTALLTAFLICSISSFAYAYNVWFTYGEAYLPYTINVLPASNPYSPYDEYMADRWNNYSDIFMEWTTRYTAVFNNGRNDQVDPFLTDSEYNSYFDTSGGWGTGAATTYRECQIVMGICAWITQYSDIAYNDGISWTTSETGSGQLFQGSALHELGHAIGLAHNFDDMSVMNYYHPKVLDDHLMPDDVRYVYDTFPGKAKTVTDMGVWSYSSNGYQSYASATATPANVNQGGNIEVDGIYVGNLSNESQSGAVVKFYLSTNTTITTFATYIGQVLFGLWARAIGGVYNNLNFSIPSSTTPGSYYVGMLVYANGTSEDSISFNNTAYLESAITVTDAAPPTPNPMTWSTEPYETSTSSISMAATTASDTSTPISYYFDYYSSPTGGTGGIDSGWQSSTSYTNSGLQTNHQYGYQVKAADNAGNETGYSAISYDYTDIVTPSGITFGAITNNSIQAMSSNTPPGLTRGSSGLIIYNISNSSDSGWKQNNNYWTSGSLSVNTRYGFYAKARNGDADETPSSSAYYRYTLANTPGVSSFSNVTQTSIKANWTVNGNPSSTEYYAENTTMGTNSGWGKSTYWNNTGLTCETSYNYRVKAKNGDGVETEWTNLGPQSTLSCATDITVTTSPSGGQITVDGTNYTAPQTFSWVPGLSHAIGVSSPQSGGAGVQYVYSSWSDGGTQNHTITAPSSPTTYTANFTTQYQLTTTAGPAAGGSVNPNCPTGCWYDSGASVPVTATANAGYTFTGWSGACSGTGTCTVTMTSAKSVTASFCQYQTWYKDEDNDFYSDGITNESCTRPAGYKEPGELVATSGDCDDNDADVHPGADDSNCNAIDENCSGTPDDGFVPTPTTCGLGVCASTGELICVNGAAQDNCVPGQPQAEGPPSDPTCSDTLDNDCDSLTDNADSDCVILCTDNDSDGYALEGGDCGLVDCDDTNAAVNPGATEICDGLDNDCDGQIDEGCIPDLIISSLLAPSTAGVGQTVTVHERTKNNGTGTAGASTTKFYLSTDNRYNPGDTELGGRTVASLTGGASSKGRTQIIIPSGTIAGNYYIIGRADAGGVFAESDEKNNTKATAITITNP